MNPAVLKLLKHLPRCTFCGALLAGLLIAHDAPASSAAPGAVVKSHTSLSPSANPTVAPQPAQRLSTPVGWTKLAGAGLPAAITVDALVVAPNGTIYVAYGTIGVFQSTDGGSTFTALTPPYATNSLPPFFTGGLQTQKIETLGVNDLNEVLVGLAQDFTNGNSALPFLFRWNSTTKTWITAPAFSAGSGLQLNQGYPVMEFARDGKGNTLAVWPFVGAIFRSVDHGNTYSKLVNMTASAAGGNSNGAGYSIAHNPTSHELFFGGEQSGYWHSTDDGVTWTPVDPGGSSDLAINQNDMGVGFTKDQEPVFSTTAGASGKFLAKWGADASITSYIKGFVSGQLNGGSSARRVIRRLPSTNSGYLFFAYGNLNLPNPVPFDVYQTDDTDTWIKITHPSWTPANNAIDSDGDSVVVGAQDGTVWRYAPPIAVKIPIVGALARKTAVTGIPILLTGNAGDPNNLTLSYQWKARGPAGVSFGSPTSKNSTASFTTAGDYVLTFLASNGSRSAATSFVVHVIPPNPTLSLIGVQSRRTHSAAGTFDLPVDATKLVTQSVTIEPRLIGSGHRIVFQFDNAVSSYSSVAVVDALGASIGALPTVALSGNEAVVTLTGIPDSRRVKVSLNGVNGSLNVSAALGFLAGDVSGTRTVTASDISSVKANAGKLVDAKTFSFDLDTDGTIVQADVSGVKSQSGLVLP